jgi:hypothetical protein
VKGLDRRAVLLALGAVVALCTGAYVALRPTDESRIREKLAKLAAAVRITNAEVQANPIGRMAHVSGVFQTLFEPDVRVSAPELAQLGSGRRELEAAVVAAPRYVRAFDVDFASVTVKLDEAHESAEVGAVAEASSVDLENRKRQEKRAVDFHFVKRDGDWLIATVSVWTREDAPPQ